MLSRLRVVICLSALLSLSICQAGERQKLDESVVTPKVVRDASLPAPGVWPSYSGSIGDNSNRHCLAWKDGWRAFVDGQPMRAMKQVGRVWIHNPGGIVRGEPMEFQQFTRCRQAAALGGNEVLERVSRWQEFTEHMSRLSTEGDLVIYVGGPHTLELKEGETDEQWLARALEELRPVRDIRPRVAIGLDAVYGHPVDRKHQGGKWARFGGPEGLNAQLVNHLVDDGHEVLFEPGLLASADWAHDRVGLIANHRYWNKQLKYGEDIRAPHYLRHWRDYLKPTEVTTRQFRYLQMLKDRTREEELALIDAIVAAGYDCIVPNNKHPRFPFPNKKTGASD